MVKLDCNGLSITLLFSDFWCSGCWWYFSSQTVIGAGVVVCSSTSFLLLRLLFRPLGLRNLGLAVIGLWLAWRVWPIIPVLLRSVFSSFFVLLDKFVFFNGLLPRRMWLFIPRTTLAAVFVLVCYLMPISWRWVALAMSYFLWIFSARVKFWWKTRTTRWNYWKSRRSFNL